MYELVQAASRSFYIQSPAKIGVVPGEGGEACLIAPAPFAPDFTLPAALTAVEAEAFEGAAMAMVSVPDACASIGDHAFRSCLNLAQIRIPADCALGADVFEGCALVCLRGAAGSSAEAYCSDAAHGNCVFVPAE